MNPIGLKSALTRLAAMPGQKRLAGALAAVAVAMAISACGSSSSNQTIGPTDANKLIAQLNAVQAAVDSRKCNQAQQLAQDFIDTVNGLPDTAGTGNKDQLRSAGQHLQDLASEPNQCKPEQTTGPSGESGAQPETTTTSTSIPTTTSTTTTSTTSTTTQPPETGNGGGNEGNGGGAPSGGGGAAGGGSGGSGGTGTGGTGGGGTG
jgi:hypothetical protein